MKVDFKFELKQKVENPFGEVGIIDTLGFRKGLKTYYVEFKENKNSKWFDEEDLTLA